MKRNVSIEGSKQRVFDLVQKNWGRNKDAPYEKIERDVEKAIAEVRGRGRSR